ERAGQLLSYIESKKMMTITTHLENAVGRPPKPRIPKEKKPMGRPPIGEKAAKMWAFRLPDELASELDAYAERPGVETRGEAVRTLLEAVLKADARRLERKLR